MVETRLCAGDAIRVGSRSRAALALANQSIIRIDQNTTLNLISVPESEPSLLQLLHGAAQFFSRKPRALRIETPFVNAAVEGTEFFVGVGADQTRVTVFEGTVATSNAFGRVDVESGQSVVARAGEAPEPVVMVRPRDAVQWALYYPPILAIAGGSRRPRPSRCSQGGGRGFRARQSGGDIAARSRGLTRCRGRSEGRRTISTVRPFCSTSAKSTKRRSISTMPLPRIPDAGWPMR